MPRAAHTFLRGARFEAYTETSFVRKSLRVNSTESANSGPCECCGSVTHRAWGFVHGCPGTEVAYFVQWAVGRVSDHGALFDLILTQPRDNGLPGERLLVALDYRLTETGPEFMVIDAAGRPTADPESIDRALARTEVVGQAVADVAFAVVDAILEQDVRVTELLGQYRMVPSVRKPWWRFWK